MFLVSSLKNCQLVWFSDSGDEMRDPRAYRSRIMDDWSGDSSNGRFLKMKLRLPVLSMACLICLNGDFEYLDSELVYLKRKL